MLPLGEAATLPQQRAAPWARKAAPLPVAAARAGDDERESRRGAIEKAPAGKGERSDGPRVDIIVRRGIYVAFTAQLLAMIRPADAQARTRPSLQRPAPPSHQCCDGLYLMRLLGSRRSECLKSMARARLWPSISTSFCGEPSEKIQCIHAALGLIFMHDLALQGIICFVYILPCRLVGLRGSVPPSWVSQFRRTQSPSSRIYYSQRRVTLSSRNALPHRSYVLCCC